jgi:spermidine/putrescine transport system permease protein
MNKFISKFYLLIVFIFLYLPIIFLIVFSFNDAKFMGSWNGFTLKWYAQLLKNDRLIKALYYTIIIAVMSSTVATIIGTITAIGINKMRGFQRKTIININYLPVLNPDIVTGISLMTLFAMIKLMPGFFTLLLSHIVFDIPYVVLAVLPKLKQLPESLEEAAMDLGATPFYTIMKVILPLIKPGILSGFLIAFTMSIDDFVISFFNAGGDVTNLSIEIFSMAKRGVSPEINALSTIMFVAVISLLLISNKKQSFVKGE